MLVKKYLAQIEIKRRLAQLTIAEKRLIARVFNFHFCFAVLLASFFQKPDSQGGQNYGGNRAGPEGNFYASGNNINFQKEAAHLGNGHQNK
jgi:hypothetical protein